jgi:hypothetical protein
LDADDDDDDDDDDDGDDGNEMLTADKALWDTFRPVITWESIHDEQFAVFATALISLMNIVSGLNTMHSVILDLVGERELEGFDLAQERWAAMDRA